MGGVLRGRSQDDLGISGQLDDAPRVRVIGQSDAAQLDIVFGGNADFGVDIQAGVALAELGAGLGEDGFESLGHAQAGLMSGGPDLSGDDIAQVDKGAPTIAGGILAPTRDSQVVPAAIAAAGAAHDDMVAAVGQEMDLRRLEIGVGKEAHQTFAVARKLA